MDKFKIGEEVVVIKTRGEGGTLAFGYKKGNTAIFLGARLFKMYDGILQTDVHMDCFEKKDKEVKNIEEVKTGDIVEVLKDNANDSYWKKGEQFKAIRVYSNNVCGIKEGETGRNYVAKEYLKLVSKTKKGDVNIMKKVISDNYARTVNALLVEKHLGNQITDTFIGGLVVKVNKQEILDEARRLEAVLQEKK